MINDPDIRLPYKDDDDLEDDRTNDNPDNNTVEEKQVEIDKIQAEP